MGKSLMWQTKQSTVQNLFSASKALVFIIRPALAAQLLHQIWSKAGDTFNSCHNQDHLHRTIQSSMGRIGPGITSMNYQKHTKYCAILRTLLYPVSRLGKRCTSKTDEFVEKFQTTFDPPPHFRKIILQFFFLQLDAQKALLTGPKYVIENFGLKMTPQR